MEHPALLSAWESFYVIIGSSAAALTGLQFVVMALGADAKVISSSTTRAFATPTIVHFCAVLLIASVISAPWSALWCAGVCIGACGVGGIAYASIVIGHARRQTRYVPVLEDWIWHAILPLAAYFALVIAAIALHWSPSLSLFVIAAAALILLFAGIHNAWDSAVYLAERGTAPKEPE
jgi:hypothetical protein